MSTMYIDTRSFDSIPRRSVLLRFGPIEWKWLRERMFDSWRTGDACRRGARFQVSSGSVESRLATGSGCYAPHFEKR